MARALAALMVIFAMVFAIAKAKEPPTLDKNALHVMRMILRDEAIRAATLPQTKTMYDWTPVGIHPPKEVTTPDAMRKAFQGNAIKAERRFSEPFIVAGKLHSVTRGRNDTNFVRFVGGGLAADQRRGFPGAGAALDLREMYSAMTGGLYAGGAQASVSNRYADVLANWEPNHQVKLRCDRAENVPLALLLEGCVPLESVIVDAEKAADRQMDLLLARKDLEIKPGAARGGWLGDETLNTDRVLIYSYWMGLWIRECQQDNYDAFVKCTEKVMARDDKLPKKKSQANQKALWERAQKDLNLQIPWFDDEAG